MPEMRKSAQIRARIDKLTDLVLADENLLHVLSDGVLRDEILEQHEIKRVEFDFEGLEGHNAGELKPPVLALPVSYSEMEAYRIGESPVRSFGTGANSIDTDSEENEEEEEWFEGEEGEQEEEEEEEMNYTEFDPKRERWRPVKYAREAAKYLIHMTFCATIFNINWTTSIQSNMQRICYPHPFLRTYLTGRRHGTSWEHHGVWEHSRPNSSPFPHITFLALQSCNAREGSMLLGELALILMAMTNRAYQAKVDKTGEEIWPHQFEYEDETRFPVLMLSFSGPQHGRISYACFDDEMLVIRQSRLYSFEKRDSAPWDLFRRIMLSVPIEELPTSSQNKVERTLEIRNLRWSN